MSSSEPVGKNFPRNPCRLETIVSVASAAVLCRRAAMMNPANPPKKVQEIVALPSAVERTIDRFMPIVKEQITWWSNFYEREIFFDDPRHRAYEYYDVLVWSADGSINDEETAREMLKRNDLNVEEKYRIACNHCLQNEVKMWRSKLKTEIDLEKAERYHALVYYWESVRRKGRATGFIRFISKNILNGEFAYPVCAVDYFLNRLNFKKRLDYLREPYLQKMTYKSWEKFLLKLTNEDFVELFYDYKDMLRFLYLDLQVMQYLMRFWMHADFVKQVWIRVEHKFPDTSFLNLLEEFFVCKEFAFHSDDHISLLVEILKLSPEHRRYCAFYSYSLGQWWNRKSNLTDVGLDVAILSFASPHHERCKFWAERWLDLFKKYPADCFLQLMGACCGEQGTEEFKMKVMEMSDAKASEYCYALLKEMRFSEIDQFLGRFSSDTGRIMITKQIILRKNFIDRVDWFEEGVVIFPPSSQLIDFIEGSFENIALANEFKIQVLSSVNCLKACYKVAGNAIFNWLKESAWMSSFRDDDFKLYKGTFFKLAFELAKSSETPDVFRDPGWMSFLEWCSG